MEQVFRHQNEVASTLMFAQSDLEADDPTGDRKLADAEAAMLDACAPLNEVAVRYRDGERVGLCRRLRLPGTIEDCEGAARTLEALLGRCG